MTETGALYNLVANAYDRDRNKSLIERFYLAEVLKRIPREARVLDLGCGSAEPIARFLIEAGCHVTGVDAAPAMLALCRERFPAMTWLEGDMRSLDLGRTFHAVIAWDSFFHLPAADQRAMFLVFERHVAAGGVLLFTSGPAAGVAIGSLYGRELYHASLDAEEYVRLLNAHGFEIVLHRVDDPECGHHTAWLAGRAGNRSGRRASMSSRSVSTTPVYQAVLFDLLTALLDSWTVWDETAGSQALGRRWRAEYLKRTYGCGAYRPYERVVAEAAVGLDAAHAAALERNWARLSP